MTTVDLTAAARRDLEEIEDWIARDDAERAAHVIDGPSDALERLAPWPLSRRPRPEIRADLRSRARGAHVIFYMLAQNGITVIRVLYGRRGVASARFPP